MKTNLRTISTRCIALMLLISLVGCEMFSTEETKSAATDMEIRKSVSKSIQQQIEILQQYQDEDIIELLGVQDMTGSEIVSKALEEDSTEYIDFCYATNQSCVLNDTSYVMNSAKPLMDSDKYNELKRQIEDNAKSIKAWGNEYAKGVPAEKQEAFYKDLKALVVKTSVMLVAAFVYVAVPPALVWGKVSAAAALSIGAGVAAGTVLDVYGYFKYGFTPTLLNLEEGESVQNMNFEEWIKKLKDSSAAAYAVATATTAFVTSTGMNKITGAIVLGVFTVYNAITAIADMKKTYKSND